MDIQVGASPDNPTRVRVQVIDHGQGVPEAFQYRVFERSLRVDPSDPRSRGGTGLGLAISGEIVERHDGTVGVSSCPGWTCCWFDLPRAKVVTS